jgi:hypothetical protein
MEIVAMIANRKITSYTAIDTILRRARLEVHRVSYIIYIDLRHNRDIAIGVVIFDTVAEIK